jgi:hypothetical protein
MIGLFGCVIATPASAMSLNGPYVKLDDNFYIGTYCHLSEGRLQNLLRTSLQLGGIAGLPGELVNLGLQNATMNKGDVMCVWLHVNYEKRDRLRNENRISRRHFADTKDSELVRTTTSYTVRVYGADKKLIGEKAGTCTNHRHCWTEVLKGSASSGGFSACLEPTLPGRKRASVVVAQGTVPVSTTSGTAADSTCESRKAEF